MEWWLNLTMVEADNLIAVARAAETAGFTGVSLGDHLLHPQQLTSPYPYSSDGEAKWNGETPWPDPWVAIAAMAASTRTLRFTTGVFIAPLRHPVNLAKALGTAAVLSGGRVMGGFGAGWMKEEFDILGVPFEGRGARMDELLEILRLLWTGRMVSYEGRHFQLPAVQMSPAPKVAPPLLIGGHGEAALRRAARHDGWIGVHRKFDETEALVAKLRGMLGPREDRPPFTVMMNVIRASPDDAERFAALGVDAAVTALLALAKGPTLADQLDGISRAADKLGLTKRP
jgi:probable F420-dependent oxidoreductase